ncbi:hypothetical protein EOD39_8621 [Acipenser ruthenus]|uniref:Uncharacterized protein n=1 Tax=Acipenser ruthenus TaxID=7906 RepID=A0A444U366_ACIRT|nr:hypothetical protein EOD39_8621 [Acipenser ruthenus]
MKSARDDEPLGLLEPRLTPNPVGWRMGGPRGPGLVLRLRGVQTQRAEEGKGTSASSSIGERDTACTSAGEGGPARSSAGERCAAAAGNPQTLARYTGEGRLGKKKGGGGLGRCVSCLRRVWALCSVLPQHAGGMAAEGPRDLSRTSRKLGRAAAASAGSFQGSSKGHEQRAGATDTMGAAPERESPASPEPPR